MIGYISGQPKEEPASALMQQPSMEEMAAQAREMMEVRGRVLRFQQNPEAYMQRNGGRSAVHYLKQDADRVGIPFSPPTDWGDVGLAFVNELGMGLPGLFFEDVREASAYAPGWAKAAGVAGSLIAGGGLVAGAKVLGAAALRRAAIKAVAKKSVAQIGGKVTQSSVASRIGKALANYEKSGALPNAKTLKLLEGGMADTAPSSTGILTKAKGGFDWAKRKLVGGVDDAANTSVDDLLKSVDDAAEEAYAKVTSSASKRAAAGKPTGAPVRQVRKGSAEWKRMQIQAQAELHKRKILAIEKLRVAATQKSIAQHMGEAAAGLAVQGTLPAAERAWQEGIYLPTDQRIMSAVGGGVQGALGGAATGMTAGALGQAPRVALGLGSAAIGIGAVTQSPEMALWGATAMVPGVMRKSIAPTPRALKIKPFPEVPRFGGSPAGLRGMGTPGALKDAAEKKAAAAALKKAAALAKRRATLAAKKNPPDPASPPAAPPSKPTPPAGPKPGRTKSKPASPDVQAATLRQAAKEVEDLRLMFERMRLILSELRDR